MSVTVTMIVFKSFEKLCSYIVYWCCLPFVISWLLHVYVMDMVDVLFLSIL